MRCGYLPNDGGGDKRGWSLCGSMLYPVLSEQGKVLAWAGRDVQFEQKEKEYQQLSPAERSSKDPPAKHRFPNGFHRGLEIFGLNGFVIGPVIAATFIAVWEIISISRAGKPDRNSNP